MPSQTSVVGGLTVPLPSAPAGTKLSDPTVQALLDFSAFYIKDALDTRVTSIEPPGSITDMCPVTNRFTFDPAEPRGIQIRLHLPALFVYWDGDDERLEWTTVKQYRVRRIHFMYMFEELPLYDSFDERHGILNAVAAALHKMSSRQRHPSFTPTGGVADQYVSQALGPLGTVEWYLMSCRKGRFGIDEGPNAARRAAKRSGRDWPALQGMFHVSELLGPETMDDPADVMPDMGFTIDAAPGDEAHPEPFDGFLSGVLDSPDGSEEDG